MRNLTRTLITLSAALGALALAPAAASGSHNDGEGCSQPVRSLGVKTNVARPPTPMDRRVEVYVVTGKAAPRLFDHYGSDHYWDWIYAETNHVPGLQRRDTDCDSGAAAPDTVLFSSELLCTCRYPFGYPPLSWLLEEDPVPQP